MSSEKIRVLILLGFFLALIVFAMTYSPTHAQTRPVEQSSPAVASAQ